MANTYASITEDKIEDVVIHSAQEALGYARADDSGERARARANATSPIPISLATYSPEHIHAIRARLGLQQRQFAEALNVSDKTVEAWEEGDDAPSGPELRLLQIAEMHPEVFWVRLGA
jgi:DNA-binding transcriptional regulator YiaG